MRHTYRAFAVCITAVVAGANACGNTESRTQPLRTNAPGSTPADDEHSTGQSLANVEYYPSAALRALAAKLGSGAPTGQSFSKHSGFIAIQVRRTSSGEPEVHDAWTDVTIVQSGHGSLLTGGTVQGGRLASGGEHRGGAISGGKSYALAAGDVIIVPAGVPHRFQIMPGDSLRYLTIKVTPDRSPPRQ